jgi:hypothetical protein
LNAYAAANIRDEVLPGARNVTGRDVAAGSALTVPLFWGFERTLGLVADETCAPMRRAGGNRAIDRLGLQRLRGGVRRAAMTATHASS